MSYLGYKTDTITIQNLKPIYHFLKLEGELEEITVTTRKKATYKSFLATSNVFTVNSDELLKAACCNLAESFEK